MLKQWMVCLLGLMLLLCQTYGFAKEGGNAAGRVVWVHGSFKAIGPSGTRELTHAGIFYEKDRLVTGAGSQAQVVFTDNSLMTFRDNTSFLVKEYRYSGGSGKYSMSLAEGGFRTITGAIGNNQSQNYQIQTPIATIGVRGTEFVVYYKNGRLYVGRIKGIPCVFDKIKRIQVCLSAETPYLIMTGPGGEMITTDTLPMPLQGVMDLTIVPAAIAPGNNVGGGSGQVPGFCVS